MKSKILVTGGTGLIGKSLQEIMPEAVYVNSHAFDLEFHSNIIKKVL